MADDAEVDFNECLGCYRSATCSVYQYYINARVVCSRHTHTRDMKSTCQLDVRNRVQGVDC